MSLEKSLEKVLSRIDERGLVDLTCQMVRIPSVNPPGDYSGMAPFMKQELEKLALKTVIMEKQPGKPNVIGLWEGAHGANHTDRTLLFSGHMDVVTAGDESAWRFPPFSATIADGAIWGRGALDMKGALAAFLYAVKAVKEVYDALPVNVLLGFTVDDEVPSPMGNKYVIEEGLSKAGWPVPSLHVLGESNDLNITGAFKGRAWIRVSVKGKSAHGGAPQDGVNAVEKMMELARRVIAIDRETSPLLGRDTINIGTFNGGSKVNIVPDECEATFDYRACFMSGAQIEEKILSVIERIQREDPEFILKEFDVFEKRDPVGVAKDSAEVLVLERAIKAALGKSAGFMGSLSAGDAYYSIRDGIPGVWVGPGDVSLYHSVNERINIDDLIDASKVYAAIILEYAFANI